MVDNLEKYLIDSRCTLIDAAKLMNINKSRCVIVHSSNKVFGIISEGDLIRALLRGADVHSIIEPYVNYGISYLLSRDIKQALTLFRNKGISLIPVLNDSMNLEGVITLSDVLNQVDLIDGVGN